LREPQPTLLAGWYYTTRGDKPRILLYLVNQGPGSMTLQRVTANGDSSGGWSFKPKQPIEMKAGRVVLIALSDFRDESGTPWPDYKRSWGCRLPVSVVVFTGDDERSINAEGLPALPSSMPRDLEDNCRERVDQG